MDRIIDTRGSGKTSRLMLLAKENDAVIVCANPRAMEQKAHAYGLVGIDFISYSDFIRNGINKNYYIDELEPFVRCVAQINGIREKNFLGYTLSKED